MNGRPFGALGYGGTGMTARQAERIGIAVSSVVALFLVSPLLVEVRLDIPLVVLGTPLHIGISRELLVGLLAGAISWAGAQSLYVLHPEHRAGTRVYSHCILPSLTAVAATVFWQRQTGVPVEGRLVVAASIGILLSLVLLGQYASLSGDSAGVLRLRTVLSVLSLATAFYLWTVLYGTRVRSLLATPGAFLIALALAIDLLQYEAVAEGRILRAALVIGLVVAECAWALNFGRLSPIEAGFFLLMVSYVTIGLTRRHFLEALTWRALGEHGLMVALLYLVMRRFGF